MVQGKQVLGSNAATASWYWVAVGSRRPAVTAAVAQTMLLSQPTENGRGNGPER